MTAYDLSGFDGVLAYGSKIREIYLSSGWAGQAWVWHEAADIRVFKPHRATEPEGDVVWIGNWGDDERTEEICEFLIEPVKRLRLKGMVYGVRYPARALRLLRSAGIEYGGWLANHEAPKVLGRYRLTIRIPRRPYAAALPGIPTIRPFEALACAIPLVSAPWQDSDRLFHEGRDFLFARNGIEMGEILQSLLEDRDRAERMAQHGLSTIKERHTCAHRIDELLAICTGLGMDTEAQTGKEPEKGAAVH